jgi:hypothetical protein
MAWVAGGTAVIWGRTRMRMRMRRSLQDAEPGFVGTEVFVVTTRPSWSRVQRWTTYLLWATGSHGPMT